jgi:hypothetical protein
MSKIVVQGEQAAVAPDNPVFGEMVLFSFP